MTTRTGIWQRRRSTRFRGAEKFHVVRRATHLTLYEDRETRSTSPSLPQVVRRPPVSAGPMEIIHVAGMDVEGGYEDEVLAWYGDVLVPSLLREPGWIRLEQFECLAGEPRLLSIFQLQQEDVETAAPSSLSARSARPADPELQRPHVPSNLRSRSPPGRARPDQRRHDRSLQRQRGALQRLVRPGSHAGDRPLPGWLRRSQVRLRRHTRGDCSSPSMTSTTR